MIKIKRWIQVFMVLVFSCSVNLAAEKPILRLLLISSVSISGVVRILMMIQFSSLP